MESRSALGIAGPVAPLPSDTARAVANWSSNILESRVLPPPVGAICGTYGLPSDKNIPEFRRGSLSLLSREPNFRGPLSSHNTGPGLFDHSDKETKHRPSFWPSNSPRDALPTFPERRPSAEKNIPTSEVPKSSQTRTLNQGISSTAAESRLPALDTRPGGPYIQHLSRPQNVRLQDNSSMSFDPDIQSRMNYLLNSFSSHSNSHDDRRSISRLVLSPAMLPPFNSTVTDPPPFPTVGDSRLPLSKPDNSWERSGPGGASEVIMDMYGTMERLPGYAGSVGKPKPEILPTSNPAAAKGIGERSRQQCIAAKLSTSVVVRQDRVETKEDRKDDEDTDDREKNSKKGRLYSRVPIRPHVCARLRNIKNNMNRATERSLRDVSDVIELLIEMSGVDDKDHATEPTLSGSSGLFDNAVLNLKRKRSTDSSPSSTSGISDQAKLPILKAASEPVSVASSQSHNKTSSTLGISVFVNNKLQKLHPGWHPVGPQLFLQRT
mmetsp:Transcript_5301/g.9180  ORF Transcript_5301/g.9180 Transcript_5301/m.9180 type:complete len:493 (+) Transcript_5301:79-1557(+)|eukprot:CAMPEP_0196658280 /NCGR_PEP_ID=MMETSP1086-20130531/28664_1 /TAXON_ID=77921 /ORGANISM="Cyanoptyche  gloeocystis , Strain SAG4.97" /LENGTH=492 /DNA_ID=CAMNT_0041991775 /DNA_START=78 /DNA_END=1556 /DNA_ORIENTATION=-